MNLTNFDLNTQKTQKFALSEVTKYIMFDLEKYRGVVFYESKV